MIGFFDVESDDLMCELYGYFYVVGNVYEYVWWEGDIVFWNNFVN